MNGSHTKNPDHIFIENAAIFFEAFADINHFKIPINIEDIKKCRDSGDERCVIFYYNVIKRISQKCMYGETRDCTFIHQMRKSFETN